MGRRSRQSGSVAVEFAVLLIPLLMLVFGITEFGTALYQYNSLAKSVRSAVRHLSLHNAGDMVAINQAQCLAVAGKLAVSCDSDPPLVPGLTVDMVDVCDAVDASACPGIPHAAVPSCNPSGCAGVVNVVTVKITGFNCNSLFPAVAAAAPVLADLTFGDISATMRQDL